MKVEMKFYNENLDIFFSDTRKLRTYKFGLYSIFLKLPNTFKLSWCTGERFRAFDHLVPLIIFKHAPVFISAGV